MTFRSGSNASQIDYFLTRRVDSCIDCKVVPSENVITEHRHLVLNVWIGRRIRKIKYK